jgi:hypothetical protein
MPYRTILPEISRRMQVICSQSAGAQQALDASVGYAKLNQLEQERRGEQGWSQEQLEV